MLGIAIVFNIIVDVMVLVFAHTFYQCTNIMKKQKNFWQRIRRGNDILGILG